MGEGNKGHVHGGHEQLLQIGEEVQVIHPMFADKMFQNMYVRAS